MPVATTTHCCAVVTSQYNHRYMVNLHFSAERRNQMNLFWATNQRHDKILMVKLSAPRRDTEYLVRTLPSFRQARTAFSILIET